MKQALLLIPLLCITACKENTGDRDYRQDMRDFVIALRTYVDDVQPNFLLIPQNGDELLTTGDGYDTPPAETYLTAIDGQGREDLLYGYNTDNKPTPEDDAPVYAGTPGRCGRLRCRSIDHGLLLE